MIKHDDGSVTYSWAEIHLTSLMCRASGMLTNAPLHEEYTYPTVRKLIELCKQEPAEHSR